MRIAINGYGRIGRCIVWAIYEYGLEKEFEIIAINDLADKSVLTHLTRFDSTHGIFKADVEGDQESISINGRRIKFLSEKNPELLPWGKLDIDVVLECSGRFKSRNLAETHLKAGAKKVLISYPMAEADKTIVYGVNHQTLKSQDRIVSNASCTTNCLAPLAKALHDSVGIKQGLMTTIHSYTNDQNLIDKAHSDPYRARAAGLSMVPTNTGAAKAVGLVIPELNGKIDGMAIRVPTANVSLVDFVFEPEKPISVNEVNALIKDASNNHLKGILAYNDQPLVSIDYNHNPASSIFDAPQTRVLGSQCKVMSWYDNEWGFSNRMLQVAKLMASLSP
ncbi:MAG: type I glyceraldehyde-3-phosphate dehydrogenase [Pseudomonadales bacterium]|nr:type I glyceraldehyde-3-phosphate dehydrogenase [Pseudomonadales bacterium]